MIFNFREINKKDNDVIAILIRKTLEEHALDIPGTVYFDEGLNHLSEYYKGENRKYYVLESEDGKVIGGIGYEQLAFIADTAELQKLYLEDVARGSRRGYEMMTFIEEKMREAGYKRSYLETHDNLQAAIHIYEKSGYREIDRPKEVVHSTMNRFFIKEL